MPAVQAHALRDIQDAVRGYLRLHPHASDTPTGIRQWWLPDPLRSTSIKQMRLVLAEMVASGELRCDALPDGSRLYALARARADTGSPP